MVRVQERGGWGSRNCIPVWVFFGGGGRRKYQVSSAQKTGAVTASRSKEGKTIEDLMTKKEGGDEGSGKSKSQRRTPEKKKKHQRGNAPDNS